MREFGLDVGGWVVWEVPLIKSELTGMDLVGVGLVNKVRGW